MTGMPASLACFSAPARAVPSIEATTRTWFFLVTMSLTWVTWVGMSSLAYWRLTL